MQSLGGGHSSTHIYTTLDTACLCTHVHAPGHWVTDFASNSNNNFSPAWLVFETVTCLPAKREILQFCGAPSGTKLQE